MRIVLLLCAAFVLRVATEPIKEKLSVQPNMTQEAMSGPAAERKTRDQPLPVMEAGNGTVGGMRSCGCGCLPDWEQYGSRCFKLFTTPMTWIDAEKYCMYFGAHLASVHNPGEHELLLGMASETNKAWIGGSNAVEISTWLWTDGSMFDYTNWAPGQPDNWHGQEKCMEIASEASYLAWNDHNCETRQSFICGTRPDGPL